MILVICGTNRPESKTDLVARHIVEVLKSKGEDVAFGDLKDLAPHLIHEGMYDADQLKPELIQFQDQLFTPADKLVVVSPEYNGSYPGMLKLLIDCLSKRNYATTFKGKKSLLVGVASGRAGNLRGMEDLTGFLNYLKIHVFPTKLPISGIDGVMSNGSMDEDTAKVVDQLLEAFIDF